MNITKVRVLWAVVIIETAMITILVANRYRIVLTPTLTPVIVADSPLQLALQYESSDAKFEELVRDNPESMEYRSPISDMPILASCAGAKKTNYVRILIVHGADVKKAAKSLEKIGADEALQLLHEVESEVRNQK